MSQEKKGFNQSGYWIDRHRQYVGDPRSIGNIGKTKEENERGDIIVREQCMRIAQHFSEDSHSVLDLGCGYGRIAGAFIDQGMSYTGIDISHDALKQAQQRNPRGRFIQQDLISWRPSTSFDLVFTLFILVHFVEDHLWKAFFEKAGQSVASGGYLVVADEFPEQRRTSQHYVARPFVEYFPLIESAGFELDNGAWDDVFGEENSGPEKAFKFMKRTH